MDYSKYEKPIEEKIITKIEELLNKEDITLEELTFLDNRLQAMKLKQLSNII